MGIFFLATGLFFILLYMIAHLIAMKRYGEYLRPLDKLQYPHKQYLAGGIFLTDLLRLDMPGRYQVWIRQKVVMLHGSRYASYYIKIHWATKILYLSLGIVLACFLGFMGEAGGDWIPLIPGLGVLLFFLADKNLDDQYKKKKLSIDMDFPDFISKLVLLVNAGLHVRQAIERIVMDSGKSTALYKELTVALSDIRGGISEQEAFSDFSERCKTKEISNFVSVLLHCMKLGGGQMIFELKKMGTDCWDMRKNLARQLGEAASAKLMLPLAIMFIAIIMICMVPAIMILRGV